MSPPAPGGRGLGYSPSAGRPPAARSAQRAPRSSFIPVPALDSAQEQMLREVGGGGPLVLRPRTFGLEGCSRRGNGEYKAIKRIHPAEWPTGGRFVPGCAEWEAPRPGGHNSTLTPFMKGKPVGTRFLYSRYSSPKKWISEISSSSVRSRKKRHTVSA